MMSLISKMQCAHVCLQLALYPIPLEEKLNTQSSLQLLTHIRSFVIARCQAGQQALEHCRAFKPTLLGR